MQVQILKENLQQATIMASRFVANKAQLPVLSHIKIEASDEGIYLTSTNLDIGMRMRVGGKIVKPGSVAVPAKLFADLVGNLGLGTVELETDDQFQLKVKTQRVNATIQGMGVEEFPEFHVDTGKQIMELQLKAFQEMWKRVGFCVSQDDTRPVLTGMLWDFSRGRLVATDGYRLSIMNDKAIKSEEESLLISGSFLREALAVVGELGIEQINFKYLSEQKQVLFEGEDLVIIGRLVDGEFPKYEAIVPKETSVWLEIGRKDFLDAVKTAAIFAQDNAHIVKLALGEEVTISANTPQVGENTVRLEVQYVREGVGQIAFNSRYLIQALTALEADRVYFGMDDELKPGLLSEKGLDGFKHVVMPVRVKE